MIACGLVVGQADALDAPPITAPAAPGSSLFAADCAPGPAESAPLPPRPILARSTFASDAPAPPAARKAALKKKTFGWKKKPSRKTRARRAEAAKPAASVKAPAPAAKPAAKAARALPKQARPHARPPARPAPRKTLPKHAIHKARVPHRPAANDAAPLRKLTYASPLCGDRAAVLQAFGVEDQMPSFGQELARAIEEAPDPGDPADASDDERGSPDAKGARNAFSSLASTPFSAFPGLSNPGGGFGPGIALPPPAGSGNGGTGNGGTGDGQGVGPSGDSPPTPITDTVPEPASWATMILGFAAIGATLRRRSLFGSRA